MHTYNYTERERERERERCAEILRPLVASMNHIRCSYICFILSVFIIQCLPGRHQRVCVSVMRESKGGSGKFIRLYMLCNHSV